MTSRWGVLGRLLVALAVFALGGATGLAGVVLHLYGWGLLLTLAAAPLTAYALPAGRGTRVPFVLGFAAVVVLGTAPRPEGDYLVAQTLNGYVLLALATAMFVGGLVTSLPRRGPRVIIPPSVLAPEEGPAPRDDRPDEPRQPRPATAPEVIP